MSVYVENIGSQKISYKDHTKIDFYSLDEYLVLAKKSISKFANSFYGGLAKKMLLDEDAVSNVAYAIMLADWRYDENYEAKAERTSKKTRYSYRNQCALWAIQGHITKKKKKNLGKTFSLDNYTDSEHNSDYYSYIKDENTQDPLDILLEKEENKKVKNYLNTLLNQEGITDKQREYINLYYFQDMTFEQIGQKYSQTREAVRQSIKKAIASIREKAKA